MKRNGYVTSKGQGVLVEWLSKHVHVVNERERGKIRDFQRITDRIKEQVIHKKSITLTLTQREQDKV